MAFRIDRAFHAPRERRFSTGGYLEWTDADVRIRGVQGICYTYMAVLPLVPGLATALW